MKRGKILKETEAVPLPSKGKAVGGKQNSKGETGKHFRHAIKKVCRENGKSAVRLDGEKEQKRSKRTSPSKPEGDVLQKANKTRKEPSETNDDAGNVVTDATAGHTIRRRKISGKAATKLQRKQGGLSRREKQKRAKRGVIYIGHLPVGFLEPQLKAFFSQFGEVCRVRLFRSRKSAHSKGYAFVEFAVREVAEIAAQAMDKYRMFGRTLVCKLTDKGQVQEHVFKNTHKPFRHINWQSRAAAIHNKPDGQLPSAKGVISVEKRMKRKAKLLKELGIDLQLPSLRGAGEEPGNLTEWANHEREERRRAKKAKLDAKKASLLTLRHK